MPFKKAIIASVLFHAAVVGFLVLGARLSLFPPKEPLVLEAKMIFKGKVRDKELLPRKRYKSAGQPIEQPKNGKAKKEPLVKPVVDTKESKDVLAKKVASPKTDYASELRKLTQSFSEEIKPDRNVVEEEFSDEDASYFDQIYALVKESFVVPPHINGPAGKSLQANIRLFLKDDGSLLKLELEHASGDEHFDKAVLEGTKSVASFGKVPILLQHALSQRGIVVEMCPFKCVTRS